MDGQRRLARSLRIFRRRMWLRLRPMQPSRRTRIAARASAIGFLCGSALLGLVQGGHVIVNDGSGHSASDWLAKRMGYAAGDIEITGLTYHSAQDVLQSIGVKPGASLIGFKASEAQETLEASSWVQSAEVQRTYPNRLRIEVTERVPFALWLQKSGYSVIDRDGVELAGTDLARLKHLPLVTGLGANLEAAPLMAALERVPELLLKVKGSARLGDRRWNIYLDNGVKVMLPERNFERALALVAATDAKSGFLSKSIAAVDLRLPDRMVIELLPPVDDGSLLHTSTLSTQ
jgi:cell division protein FtsQ